MQAKIVPWYGLTYQQAKEKGFLPEIVEWVTVKLAEDKREDYIKYLCGCCNFPNGFEKA